MTGSKLLELCPCSFTLSHLLWLGPWLGVCSELHLYNVRLYMYLQCGYMYILLLAALSTFLCCRYLSDEDDGVSEAMIPFAVQYLSVLKVHTQITYTICTKCIYIVRTCTCCVYVHVHVCGLEKLCSSL